jgi:hypothetical protein
MANKIISTEELEKLLGKKNKKTSVNKKRFDNGLIHFEEVEYTTEKRLPNKILKNYREIVDLMGEETYGKAFAEPKRHVNSFFDIPLNMRTFFKNERADYALAYNLVHSRVMRLSRKKVYFEITDDPNFGLLEKQDREELETMQFMIMLDIEDPNDEVVIKFKQKHSMEV